MSSSVGSVVFIVALIVAVMLHEWGHYATARRFGMRAEKFFFGFGPTLWSTRRGETEYGVKAIPLGGFVRVVGMSTMDVRQRPVADVVFDSDAVHADRRATAKDDGVILDEVPAVPERTLQRLREELERRGTPARLRGKLVAAAEAVASVGGSAHEVATAFQEAVTTEVSDSRGIASLRHRILLGDEGRFFHDRPAWQRAIVLVSGSGMHFVQAFALLFVAFWGFGSEAVPELRAVIADSPAAEAALQPGDRIVAADGRPIEDFNDARSVISQHPGERITLVVERDGERIEVDLVPVLSLRQVFLGSDLAEAGFYTQDRISAVAGQRVATLDDIHAAVGDAETVDVEVVRTTSAEGAVERDVVEDVPAELLAALGPDDVAGVAGFIPEYRGFGAGRALAATFSFEPVTQGVTGVPGMVRDTFAAIGNVFGPEGIASLVRQVGGEDRDINSGQSIVGVTVTAGEIASSGGWFWLLIIVVSLNVFVGVLNLVPLPPLDGGHLAVLAVETGVNGVRRVVGKAPDFRVDPRTITAVAIPVLLILGVVFFSLVFLDVTNPIRLPG